MRNYISILFILCTLETILFSCKKEKINIDPKSVMLRWADMTLYITKNTPGNSPTFASRGYGYMGLTMYESIVQGFPQYNSLNHQLNGLNNLPKADTSKKYNWILSLNAAQARILSQIYVQTSDQNKLKIDSLEKVVNAEFKEQADFETNERSKRFGQSIADSIFSWSISDGGHRGYLHNFDKKMTYPDTLGSWKPPLYAQSFSHFPLHPHWGENRTFIQADASIPDPVYLPYDTSHPSSYYKIFDEVYNYHKHLSQSEKETAIWWADDPDVTFTPPGHSYYLASTILKIKNPELIEFAMTFAAVGISVADAFIDCWKWKYKFFTERPNTFIPMHIDQSWESFWPEPPFPAFPSGHAIQGSAAGNVLKELYGNNIHLIDSAHYGRHRDDLRNADFKPRSFDSLTQIINEIADSRFYGGIHNKLDNQRGIEKGEEIAMNVMNLKWKK